MNQPAFALPAGQALSIHNDNQSPTLNATKGHGDFRPEFETELIDSVHYKSISVFRFADKVKISFGLQHPYAAHFVLTKGLLEFHRGSDFVFDYNRVDRTFHVSVGVLELSRLRQFLNSIAVWLDEELNFKATLKKVIAFEKDYKLRAQEIYTFIS